MSFFGLILIDPICYSERSEEYSYCNCKYQAMNSFFHLGSHRKSFNRYKLETNVYFMEKTDLFSSKDLGVLDYGEDYHFLLNSLPIGIYRSTADGKLLLANDFFKNMMGISLDENIVDLNWLSNKLSYNRKEFANLLSINGSVEDFFSEYRKDDGSLVYCLESAKLFFDEVGKIKFIEGIVTDITSFKTVQDALYESEEKYRLLFEKSEDPILLIDGDKWADCNQAALKFFGFDRKEELVGTTPYDNSPEQQAANISSKDKAKKMIQYAFEHGFNRFDWVHRNKSGGNIYVDVMLTAIPFKKKTLLFTMLRDISKRISTEKDLKISEEKFRLVFEKSNDGMIITDSKGIIIDCNPALTNITGYAISDIIGSNIRKFLEMIETDSNNIVNLKSEVAVLYDLLLSGSPEIISSPTKTPIKRKDGSIAYTQDHSFVIESAYGKLVCTIIRDISDIHSASEEIISQKELFETLIQTSPIAIMQINFNGEILFASQKILEYLNFKMNAEKPISLKSIVDESNHSEIDLAIKSVKEKAYLNNLEMEIVGKNGQQIQVEINASLIAGKSNQEDSIIVTIMDISERHSTEIAKEEALQATIDALAKQHEAIELLEKSARLASIGVITGGIIHEISQPLNAIRIGADGIVSWNKTNGTVLPSPIISMLNGISNASMRIDNVIKHMRNIWIDTPEDNLEKVDLNETVLSALNLARLRAQSHEIFFDLNLANEQLCVLANKIQLELVINNLITNSVKSLDKTQKSRKIIRLKSYRESHSIILIVYDNGIGLPDVGEDKLFDPFYSTDKDDGGTGLGLSIVKMFLQKFSAKISTANNSDDEGGATFTIHFNIISKGALLSNEEYPIS